MIATCTYQHTVNASISTQAKNIMLNKAVAAKTNSNTVGGHRFKRNSSSKIHSATSKNPQIKCTFTQQQLLYSTVLKLSMDTPHQKKLTHHSISPIEALFQFLSHFGPVLLAMIDVEVGMSGRISFHGFQFVSMTIAKVDIPRTIVGERYVA